MARNLFSLIFPLFFLAPTLSAQPALYLPREFQQAVEKGTRALAGQPGPRYWQNSASYRIDAKVKPADKRIEGRAEITYVNNSPDTLWALSLKLIQNVHLLQARRASYVDPGFYTQGISLSNVRVDKQPVDWNDGAVFQSEDPTNAWLSLPAPLLPGAGLQLELEWNYQLQTSKLEHREGMVDESALFAAYWYPRIAVYDDISGWDRIPHNVQTEFYGDFNDYDVTVRVPPGFAVWATGELANAEEVLSPLALERLLLSYESDTVVPIFTRETLAAGQAVQPAEELAWRFTAENVTDFAFGASDHYRWDAASITVDSATGRRASVQAAYQPETRDFDEVAEIARACIGYFSTKKPGIPYPYPTMTVFNGHGQMEFPMMVNDVDMYTLDDTRALTAHEVAHTYFPFLTGTNESAYAWMDEGWATLLEFFACTELYTLENPEQSIYPGYYLRNYVGIKGAEVDVPMLTPSHQLLPPAYQLNSYGKPAAAYLSLYNLLQEDTFLDCVREYVERWRGKHPQPYDFFFTISECSGQDLSWFWQRWFMEFHAMDLALAGYRQEEGALFVTVRNDGGLPLPVPLEVEMEDGSTRYFRFSPIVWEGNSEVELELPLEGAARSVYLVWKDFRDVDPEDDRLEVK
ncbi:MAG: M1 family metallopeptidase [Phaeodactylibacter sp.]|nr:M1 family metallopeptidase [Phaeodactylibacter sp.]MCB9294873.1 M1 family metallopeptidase [Lewinellaceae bacterium]